MSKLILFFLPFLIAFTSCEDTPNNTNADDPENLTLNIVVADDESGDVKITATADKTIAFHFDLGDGTPVKIQDNGTLNYNYEATGVYLVTVKAFGESGRFLKKDQQITVIGEDNVNVGDGYTTPVSYDNMDLVWADEFTSSTLNMSDWSYDNGDGCPNLCGWGNNELQYYRPENSWLENGVFTIQAVKENYQGRAYTSTKIVTRDKKTFQYGRIDIRATLPKGQGIWPALWMLGQNQASVGWPKCGEVDIMEMIGGNGRENTVYGNMFWDNNGVADNPKNKTLSSGTFYDKYHVFSLLWDEQQIQWLVDDEVFHSMDITTPDRTEFHQPFYLIMNIAVGGNWPGSPDASTDFPTQMKVDYIRVFQDK